MNIKDLDRRYIIKAIKITIEENYLANTLNDFATGFATWYETVTPELCEELKEENENGETFDIDTDETEAVEYYYRFVMDDAIGNAAKQEAFKQEMYDYDQEMKRKAFAHNC